MAARTPAECILAAIRAIPRGQVAGYGHIAQRAGFPRRARMVARLLSQNDDPLLPWHRVLRSDGRIAFPPGSEGFVEQRDRLRREGVMVSDEGKVKVEASARSLDQEIWG
jgi:methylated-DNA-protein-cysteine methyltransferase related protein